MYRSWERSRRESCNEREHRSFAPKRPEDVPEENWIQTVPGKGWFPYLRFYSPTEAFFNATWKPGDIVEVK